MQADILAVLCGSLVGFILALIGGGGSILATPLLLYVVGLRDPHVVIGTGALAVGAAVALPLVSPLLIKAISTQANLAILPLIPLFAWAMVPLAMANVLLNNLMARSRFTGVPAMVLVAVFYWLGLQRFHGSFDMVARTMGGFNLLFLLVCVVFTWEPWARRTPARA